MKNNKIVITGGTGFIGAKLVERIVSMGNRPVLLIRKQSDTARIIRFIKHVDLVETDLLRYKHLNVDINKIKPDIIFHLSGYGVYSYTNFNPHNTKVILETNVLATSNLLHAAENAGCKVFVNTGTCFEYGDSKIPFKETDQLNPCNVYGASKVMSSLICNILSKTFKMKVITLRPFTVYGPDQDNRRFIATVINSCFKEVDLKLTRERIIRDYTFIDDVIDAYIITAEKGKEFSGEVFNISTGYGITLKYLANLTMQLEELKKIKIQEGIFPERQGEVHSLIGNPKKANKLLGWKAKHSLNEGLLKTIAWHKQEALKKKSF
jgi:UDP-glucose 4-epimerase